MGEENKTCSLFGKCERQANGQMCYCKTMAFAGVGLVAVAVLYFVV